MSKPILFYEDPGAVIDPSVQEILKRVLGDWYDRHRRDLPWRRTRDPYAIWISEVMLQQTQVKTVVPYFQRFLQRFADVPQLAAADAQAVLKAWEGLGYYSRARHLHRAAQLMCATTGGKVPSEWPVFRQLPGVGDYIAAAVLSIAFARPFAVVDGNVKRVLARLLCLPMPVNSPGAHRLFQSLADQLLDAGDPGRHNQAMMELGALVCTPKQPLCAQCPLARECMAHRTRTVDQYPHRAVQRPVGTQLWAAGVVVKNGRLLLTQRPAEGLLAGLWEFPAAHPGPGEDPAQACLNHLQAALGLQAALLQQVASVRHAYTHFKLRMEVYLCRWLSGRVRLKGPADFRWVRPGQIESLPLHRAVHKAFPELEKWTCMRKETA